MPIFVELITDAFQDTFDNQKANRTEGNGRSGRAGTSRARRPMRGLEIKDDTYAFLKVVRADGTEIELFDSGSENGRTKQYTNFLLQSVQEAHMEKHQIVDTFGEPYIFFFGEQPRFLDVTAVLINSHDFNWEAEFWANYNTYLRGTKLVEMGARTYLFYDDNVVEGYWLQAQAVKTSDQPLSVQLSFRLFVTNISNVSLVGDANFPIRSSVYLPADIDLRTADGFTLARAAGDAAVAVAGEESRQLTAALRDGLLGSGADLTGILQNAQEVLGDLSAASFRSRPVRSLITDNFDEYTHLPPSLPEAAKEDHDGEMTVVDSLPAAAVESVAEHGAEVDDEPGLLEELGLAPHFWNAGGPGWRAGGVTFGPVSAQQGGVGFTGQPYSMAPGGPPPPPFYSGGVQTGGGLFGGVGVGGGVSGGLAGSAFGQLTGAASFRGPNQAASYPGTGVGACSVVGGRPSAFATVVVGGTLNESGDLEAFAEGSSAVTNFRGRTKRSYFAAGTGPDGDYFVSGSGSDADGRFVG
jgi:hypothetical protein